MESQVGYIRVTTIDQHRGDHAATGLPVMELRDVTTDLSSHASGDWDGLSPEDRVWWDEVMDEMHALDVLIAGQDADKRAEIAEAMAAEFGIGRHYDLEYIPAAMRRVLLMCGIKA